MILSEIDLRVLVALRAVETDDEILAAIADQLLADQRARLLHHLVVNTDVNRTYRMNDLTILARQQALLHHDKASDERVRKNLQNALSDTDFFQSPGHGLRKRVEIRA